MEFLFYNSNKNYYMRLIVAFSITSLASSSVDEILSLLISRPFLLANKFYNTSGSNLFAKY